jgi:hypothetical protein
MTPFQYYLDLRAELYAIVAKVEDASSWDIFFRPTDSNFVTKYKLESLYNEYKEKAVPLGLVQVTRHISCPNPKHIAYIVSNDYGLDIENQDEAYVWHEYQSPDTRRCICPCSPDNKSTSHDVLDELIYPVNKEIPCAVILSILGELRSAISCSTEGRPRSGIRCHLLMAIMKIDNQLIPGGLTSYLEHLRMLCNK